MEEENKEPGFILTSTKTTKVSFKKVPLKLRLKIMLGGDAWVTTVAQIAVKQEIEPIAVNDGIEISISEHLKQK
jgi:hypothetical protein